MVPCAIKDSRTKINARSIFAYLAGKVSKWYGMNTEHVYRSPFWRSTTPVGNLNPCRAQSTAPTPVAEYPLDFLVCA